LPEKTVPKLHIPTDKELKLILDKIKGTELEKAVLLAAFG